MKWAPFVSTTHLKIQTNFQFSLMRQFGSDPLLSPSSPDALGVVAGQSKLGKPNGGRGGPLG